MKKKLADRYYNRFDFYKAIPMYQQLLKSYPRNYELTERLADSYRRINDAENAEPYYERLVDTTVVKHELLLYYAQTLAHNGKYEKASAWYQKYAEVEPGDRRGSEFPVAYKNLTSFFRDSSSCLVRKMPFCSDLSDFSPAYYGKNIVFASARKKVSFVRFFYNWTYSSFIDLYEASPDSENAVPFSKGINSIYHEGPVTFTKNQDTIIFTRSNFYHLRLKKSSDGVNKLKLYQASWNQHLNKWVNVTPLPFNNDQFSVGHPTLAADGMTLYFASDMPGGFGGTDIYISHLVNDPSGKKTWGTPVNLGPEINSPGNELFPFIDNEGNLWFASNGIPGLGGLDVFLARKKQNGFEKPVNPGYPMNTRFDDFGYITKNAGKEGYISSDRYNAVGNDDIFKLVKNKLTIKGLVRDTSNTNKPVENAEVILLLSDNSLINKAKTDADGQFSFDLSFDKNYLVKASKTGYTDRAENVTTIGVSAGELSTVLHMGKKINRQVELFCTILDKKTGEKLNGVEISINDPKNNSTIVDTITSAEGSFRKKVPNVKINDQLAYKVTINKKGYLAKNIDFNYTVSSYQINLSDFIDVALDKIDVGTDIGKLLHINPIYFDLGKWNIRPDAAAELNKIVKTMNENPGMTIELGSHTDSRGSSQSNLSLSDKRAKASAAYIVSKGIDKKRIIGKGYGESRLINRCMDGVDCTEEEHAANRRTEFKVTAF
jgi:outer membrane protein OmpA-like peptidoglycan-associated protein